MQLSPIDILFDLIVGVFFAYTIIFALYSLKHLKERRRQVAPIFVLLVISSSLYLFQTIQEAVTGSIAGVRVWDMYNVVQAMVNLASVQILSRHCARNLQDAHPITRNLPFC